MKKLNKYNIYAISGILLISIGLVAYFLVQYNSQERIKSIEENLSYVARFKAKQINEWFDERIKSARTIQNAPNYQNIKSHLAQISDSNSTKDILEWIIFIKKQFDYDDIWLLDDKLNIRLSLNGLPAYLVEEELLKKLKESKEVYFSDIARKPAPDNHLFYRIIIPLLDENENVYSFFVFEKNPEDYLFPLLQYWPVKLKSAETILFRRDEDSLLILNNLKFKDSAALNLGLPWDDSVFWGHKITTNSSGLIDSKDYRGEEVLGVIEKLPNSNWYIKIKVDKAELFAPVYQESYIYIIIFGMLSLLLILFVNFIWKAKNINHLEALLKSEKDKSKLQKIYDLVFLNANDSIILLDHNLNIIEVNQTAVKLYGYSEDEFRKLNASDIRAGSESKSLEQQYLAIPTDIGLVLNVNHRRKDGSVFPVEASLGSFMIDDVRFYISVIRDITERVETEKKINQLNRLYSVLSQVNSMIVHESDELAILTKAAKKIAGYGQFGLVAVIGKQSNNRLAIFVEGSESQKYNSLFSLKYIDHKQIFESDFKNDYILCNELASRTYLGPSGEKLISAGYKCCLSVPIKKEAEIFGVIMVYAKEKNSFEEDSVLLFKEISNDLSFVITSIEANKQKEKSRQLLIEYERKLNAIFKNMPGAVYRRKNDPDWTMEFVSENIFQLSGWHSEDIIDNRNIAFKEIIDVEDRERIWLEDQQNREAGQSYNMIYKIWHNHGFRKVISDNALPVYDDSGNIIAIEGIIFDITELEEATLKLEESEVRYKYLVDNSALGITMADLSGKILIANSAFSLLLKCSPEDLIGTNYKDLNINESLKNLLKEKFFRNCKIKNYFKV